MASNFNVAQPDPESSLSYCHAFGTGRETETHWTSLNSIPLSQKEQEKQETGCLP